MHTTLRKAGLVTGFVLFAISATAQVTTLTGIIKDDNGQPLRDAVVRIERLDIKGTYKSGKSNRKGEYIHAGLPIGTYKLTLEVDGKDRDTMDRVRTSLSQPTEINWDLSEQKKRREAQETAIASGTVTKEMARDMTPEQKAAMEKALKERQAAMSKNKELNAAFGAGMEAIKNQQFDVAVEQLTKASELDPKQHIVWGQLAEAYMGQARVKTGDEQTAIMNKAFDTFKKAIELKPDDAAYYNNYALALARGRKFDEAQTALNKAAEIDPPKAGTYYYNLGALLVNNQQLEPAGAAFKKAIEADPNHADSHYQYGIFLISKAQTTADGKVIPVAGTKESFQKYLELKPDGPFAESAKGMLSTLDAQISTEYKNPTQKKGAAQPKKK